MDAKLKAKWVEALRFGEYRQSTRQLRKLEADGHVAYCCLGVLCEVAHLSRHGEFYAGPFGDKSMTQLPMSFARSIGLAHSDSVIYGGKRVCLTTLNDDVGLSFKEIAALIEEQL